MDKSIGRLSQVSTSGLVIITSAGQRARSWEDLKKSLYFDPVNTSLERMSHLHCRLFLEDMQKLLFE